MKNNKESKARERKRDMQLKGPMSLTEQFIIPSRVLCRIYTQWVVWQNLDMEGFNLVLSSNFYHQLCHVLNW
ncbi:hypothetical protein QQP08_018506 [Theobroma cacao]|nr:hypothetical protein QQP08_018506 [Theobroma cacao]